MKNLFDDESIAKKLMIYVSHRFNGEPLRGIGACFAIGESAVSLSSNRFSQTLKSNGKLRKKIDKVKNQLDL